MRVYGTDGVMHAHAQRAAPADAPALAALLAMDMDDRWVNHSPQVMLDTFHWFRGEGFALILDDLAAMPSGPPVIVEGFRLLPSLVQSQLDASSRAVWLLPTPE